MPVHQLDPYRVSDIREIDGKPNSQQVISSVRSCCLVCTQGPVRL